MYDMAYRSGGRALRMAGEEGFKWRLEEGRRRGEVGAPAAVIISRCSFKEVLPKNTCCFK